MADNSNNGVQTSKDKVIDDKIINDKKAELLVNEEKVTAKKTENGEKTKNGEKAEELAEEERQKKEDVKVENNSSDQKNSDSLAEVDKAPSTDLLKKIKKQIEVGIHFHNFSTF